MQNVDMILKLKCMTSAKKCYKSWNDRGDAWT